MKTNNIKTFNQLNLIINTVERRLKNMKAIGLSIMLVLAMFAFSPFALAEETDVVVADEGVTPDSLLYGLDKAMERISLALTFDKAKRSEKALQHAEERLAEVKAMIEQNKLDKAEKARKGHEDDLNEAEEAAEEIESDDDEEEAEEALLEVSEIKDKIESHSERVALIHDRILEMLASNPNVSEEQLAHLTEIFDRIQAKAEEMEAKVAQKRENAKLKLKVTSEMTDEEIEERISEARERAKAGRGLDEEVEETETEEIEEVEVEETETEEIEEVEVEETETSE